MIKVLSLFDGLGGARLALDRLGVECKYYASEIDPYTQAVSQYNYPDTVYVGDITQISYINGTLYWFNGSEKTEIDLVVGGSPCQGFSFAGKQLNFDDPRSKLFFEYTRLLKEINPKWFLLENVKMKKEHERVISEYLGVEPILINSALVSAQNRQRLYWTNLPIDQPEDLGITWKDVRENGVSEQKFYYSEGALSWIHQHGQRKKKTLKIHADNEKMQMVEASHHKKYSSQRYFAILDNGSTIAIKNQKEAITSIRGRRIKDGRRVDQDKSVPTQQWLEFNNTDKSACVTTAIKDNVVVPFTLAEKILAEEFAYRYITPLECERLQTVPDDYTHWGNFNGVVKKISDTQRYKMLGNGFTIDVIAHILKGII